MSGGVGGQQGARTGGAVGQHLGHVDSGAADALARQRVDDGEAGGGRRELSELQADGGVGAVLSDDVSQCVGLLVAGGQPVA